MGKRLLQRAVFAVIVAFSPAVQAQEADFNAAWVEMLELQERMKADIRILREMVEGLEAIRTAHKMEPRARGYNALAFRAEICRNERMSLWCEAFDRRFGPAG